MPIFHLEQEAEGISLTKEKVSHFSHRIVYLRGYFAK